MTASSKAPSLKELYRRVLRIRLAEERIANVYVEQEMRCPVHLSVGQEAAAVGVCAAMTARDYAFSSHRSHGHYLAKGGDLKSMYAELYGRGTGCSIGKGGSMHLVDLEAGFLGAAPIVGSTIAIAAGAAFGAQMKGEGRVVAAFFGDGATEEGVFHETLNFAALKKVPVVFACENNLYSVYSPLSVRQPPGRKITAIAQAHGIPTKEGDGNDVEDTLRLAQWAVDHARAGKGPAFIELSTYRWREHCGPNYDNDIGYRSPAEFEAWKKKDPVATLKVKLIELKLLTEEGSTLLERALNAEIDEALRFAKQSPYPDKSLLLQHVYAPAKKTAAADKLKPRKKVAA